MTLEGAHRRKPKSVTEHGVCFGTALAVLTLAAIALQWLFSLI